MKPLRLFVLVAGCAVSAFPAADQTPLAAARLLYDGGQYAEAQQAFEKIAAGDPNNADALFYLGRIALWRDDQEKGATYLEKAVELAPNNAGCHHALGDAYGRSAQKAGVLSKFGWARKCKAEYERAVALAPDNVDYRQSLFEYYRQAPSIAGGGTDKATAQAEEIKKLDPRRGRLAFASLYVSDQKYDEAFAQFEEVLRTSPDDYAALYQFGRLAANTGQRLDLGLASLRRCLELAPAPSANTPPPAAAQWRIGSILEKKGDPAGARAAYEAALKLDPKFAQAADALKKLK